MKEYLHDFYISCFTVILFTGRHFIKFIFEWLLNKVFEALHLKKAITKLAITIKRFTVRKGINKKGS